ncbi:DUF748 domain-containing protein [Marinicella rhabdoformis]|uniref:DUF748 domain-containing protein n=1 Tax=Marinicella rhabdoformis TaxID=2580566 RepID=UPI0012AEC4AE|nr:DUF748 domain-containing protein [Marinicella rhabdoformis]
MKVKSTFKFMSYAIGLLFFLYVVLGFFFVSKPLGTLIQDQTRRLTGMEVSYDDITFNPLSFSVQLNQVQITDHKSQAFLTAKTLSANFNPSQLLFGQYHLSHITLVEPVIALELDADFQLSQPSIVETNQSNEAITTTDINLLIDQLSISKGAINLFSSATNKHQHWQNLTFNLNHFNLEDIGSDFKLNLSSSNKEQLMLNGQYNHHQQSITAEFATTNGLSQTAADFLPDSWELSLEEGSIHANGHLNWALSALPTFDIETLEWSDLGGFWSEKLTFSKLFILTENIQINLNEQLIDIKSLAAEQGQININWPWETQEPTQPSDEVDNTSHWQYSVEQTTGYDLSVQFSDASLQADIQQVIDSFHLNKIDNKGTIADFQIKLSDHLNNANNYHAYLDGNISSFPSLVLDSDIEINNLNLENYSPWIQSLSGIFVSQGLVSGQQQLSIKQNDWHSVGSITLNNITLQEDRQVELANIGTLYVADSHISSPKKRIVLNQITLDQASGTLPTNINEAQPPNQTNPQWQIIFGHKAAKE